MNILIPVAGRGSRFLAEADKNPEYKKPKPIINILGRTMVEWALASYPLTENDKLIFIVSKDHVVSHQIDNVLRNIFGEKAVIITQDEPPRGAACTALLAKQHINNAEPLLITDSDHFIDGITHFKEIEKHPGIDGMIPVFYANNQKWSYAKANDEGIVIEVAEKFQISRTANIGAYYFGKGRDFVWAAEEMIEEDDKVNGEFFIAPVYNYLVRRGKKIRLSRPEFVHGLGTPKDLDKFLWFLSLGEVKHNFNDLQDSKPSINEQPKEAISEDNTPNEFSLSSGVIEEPSEYRGL